MSLISRATGENSLQGLSKCSTCCNSSNGGGSPRCDNCRRSGSRGPQAFRFRHCNNPSITPASISGKPGGIRESESFSENQPWLKISSDLVFIDQTKELQTTYDGLHSREGSAEAAPEFQFRRQTDSSSWKESLRDDRGLESAHGHPSVTSDDYNVEYRLRTPISVDRNANDESSGQQHSTSEHTPLSALPFQLPDYVSTPIFNIEYNQNIPRLSTASGPYHRTESSWPAFSAEEAHLMRHFIQNLTPWFDVCDEKRHFELLVPQCAATSLPLRNAIFATSARHLSRAGNYDPSIAARYYQECLDVLIPMVKESEAVMDETLLVATVILRLLEELEAASHRESRPSGHLVGIQTLINAQNCPTLMTSSLRRAAFLVAVRQEIFMAFIAQRAPVQSACFLENSLAPTDDDTWAFRMVFHCSDVLEFTYGPYRNSGGEERTERWLYLVEYTRKWLSGRPSFFLPIYHTTSAEKVLPVTIFHTETHLIAALHYHMSLILLAISNPALADPVSLSSFSSRSLIRELDETVRDNVKMICGFASGRESFATAAIIASAVVARCGEFFGQSSRREQEALLDVLEITETRHAWPTADARRSLRETWRLCHSSDAGE